MPANARRGGVRIRWYDRCVPRLAGSALVATFILVAIGAWLTLGPTGNAHGSTAQAESPRASPSVQLHARFPRIENGKSFLQFWQEAGRRDNRLVRLMNRDLQRLFNARTPRQARGALRQYAKHVTDYRRLRKFMASKVQRAEVPDWVERCQRIARQHHKGMALRERALRQIGAGLQRGSGQLFRKGLRNQRAQVNRNVKLSAAIVKCLRRGPISGGGGSAGGSGEGAPGSTPEGGTSNPGGGGSTTQPGSPTQPGGPTDTRPILRPGIGAQPPAEPGPPDRGNCWVAVIDGIEEESNVRRDENGNVIFEWIFCASPEDLFPGG